MVTLLLQNYTDLSTVYLSVCILKKALQKGGGMSTSHSYQLILIMNGGEVLMGRWDRGLSLYLQTPVKFL